MKTVRKTSRPEAIPSAPSSRTTRTPPPMASTVVVLFRFLISAGTDLAFIPALGIVHGNKRHFELFVGVLQLVASFFYNATDALGISLFLKDYQWHFISDVMSITYVCLVCIQYMQLPSADLNTLLRYVAFTGAWISKFKDGWESGYAQGLVIVGFIIAVAARLGTGQVQIASIHQREATIGAGLLAAAGLCLGAEVTFGDTSIDLLMGIGHVWAGAACYFLWKACPCADRKMEELPGFA